MAQGKNTPETEFKRMNAPKDSSRRRAVKTIAGSITALAAYQYLPAKWEKPILESIFIPAHAQTSGNNGIAPVDPSIPVTPGHPDHPDYPFAPNHPDHPHNNPMAVIGSFTTIGINGTSAFISADITINRIAQYTFTLVNQQNKSSDTLSFIAQTIPVTVSPTFSIQGKAGDDVVLTVTNNLTSEVDTAPPYFIGQAPSLSCSGTPACGSTVSTGQPVSVTVTVSPNPGAGQQVTWEPFCGGFSLGANSTGTNANGEITTPPNIIPANLCDPNDGTFKIVFTYLGASCTCEWLLP